MKAVIQRVSSAAVAVEGETVGQIAEGFLVLLGVYDGDDERDADKLARKIPQLRIFKDENEKMNRSLLDIGGEMLVISQFTLCADCTHGRRPSFIASAPPERANTLYEHFVAGVKSAGVGNVQTGRFGADMKVSLLNDGPVTILLDSKELR